MEAVLDETTREKLLADPSAILGDRDLMRALVAARESEIGHNVIDIRGRAMEALETRLDRLETAHESVISAAYDNQSGMAVVHRAVLALLEPQDAAGFVENLQAEVAPLLRVDTLRLIFEAKEARPGLPDQILLVPQGTVGRALAGGRRTPRGDDIILRKVAEVSRPLHATDVASEALIPLDLGPGHAPALLLMGSAEVGRFSAAHGTDLLRFFGQAFRLALLGWLRE
ncbi:DUF484 family protein [Paracoccus tegillarcae]|uniref:DUF484 domain-containing protein n=1 Tax=Paracoccus tegillarcae TaxID=1529068 RepID=A0A2K9F0X9_9RHOB|nr:DUF484 family protein [Paracoccus tegillarcae]AUH32801.1 DUF484 domain-containing protein [Paracoccus tegillarcae]